jgi:glutaredoxin
MTPLPKLYVKSWCPWCISAKQYLDKHRYRYEEIDVLSDPAAYKEMIRLSGQSYAPTLVVNERILADFGPEELDDFLKSNRILPQP